MKDFTVKVTPGSERGNPLSNEIVLTLTEDHPQGPYGYYVLNDSMQGLDLSTEDGEDEWEEVNQDPEGLVLFYAVERIAELEAQVAQAEANGTNMTFRVLQERTKEHRLACEAAEDRAVQLEALLRRVRDNVKMGFDDPESVAKDFTAWELEMRAWMGEADAALEKQHDE